MQCKQLSTSFLTLIAGLSMILFIVIPALVKAEEISIEGYWISEGYGFLLEITSDSVGLKEITSISCISRDDGLTRQGQESDGSWRLSTTDDPEAAFIVPETKTSLRLKRTGTASDIFFRRTAAPRPSVAVLLRIRPSPTSMCTGRLTKSTTPSLAVKTWTGTLSGKLFDRVSAPKPPLKICLMFWLK
jgi:hypothetical protein